MTAHPKNLKVTPVPAFSVSFEGSEGDNIVFFQSGFKGVWIVAGDDCAYNVSARYSSKGFDEFVISVIEDQHGNDANCYLDAIKGLGITAQQCQRDGNSSCVGCDLLRPSKSRSDQG